MCELARFRELLFQLNEGYVALFPNLHIRTHGNLAPPGDTIGNLVPGKINRADSSSPIDISYRRDHKKTSHAAFLKEPAQLSLPPDPQPAGRTPMTVRFPVALPGIRAQLMMNSP